MTYLKSYDFKEGSIYKSLCKNPYISDIKLVKEKNIIIKNIFWDGAIRVIEKYISCFFNEKIKKHWQNDKIIFRLALSSYEYGGVYFLSRHELETYRSQIIKYSEEINEVYNWFSEKKLLNITFNLCINYFVFNWGEAESKGQMIAPYQFQMSKNQKLYYRDDGFYINHNLVASLGDIPVYDLHDFAHVVSTLCKPSLYGCYYHDLPEKITNDVFRRLISIPHNEDNSPISDGFLYSKITRKLYDNIKRTNDYQKIADVIGERIANYLMGYDAIKIGERIYRRNMAIKPYELIILAINKLYESSASEVERFVIIRNDNSLDLSDTTAVERLLQLSQNSQWLYAEARNTLRHRGHCESYRRTLSMLAAEQKIDSYLYKIINGILDFNMNQLRLGISILKKAAQDEEVLL
ncbi:MULTISPECIES: hypothetical protein [unclassified Brenneria]|uniref:hypothetical protein n=1 Tax=unclassified Brenneria TaxID=2634434 RepID=UPI001551A0A1|nr:hypothetical protein [Brenneria sp. hezel4-2-4]MEE3652591.1 hypothetical protein [Brenneria sp. HEZEL_4_2_4]NPD02548.1 hypothetical protein [Brenneria sp. hezel4-2-4]